MTDTNMQDIAAKLQAVEKGILMLRDCYVVLHNDLIRRKVDPEGSMIAYMNQVKMSVNNVVKECAAIRDQVRHENEGCYKWIASHIDKIEQRLEKIEAKDEKKLKVKVYFEGEEERIKEKEGDITSGMALETLFSAVKGHKSGKLFYQLLKKRWDASGKRITYTKIGRELGMNAQRVSWALARVIRWCAFLHQQGTVDITKLPSGPLKTELLKWIS